MPEIFTHLFKALKVFALICVWFILTVVATKLSPCFGVAAFFAFPVSFFNVKVSVTHDDDFDDDYD